MGPYLKLAVRSLSLCVLLRPIGLGMTHSAEVSSASYLKSAAQRAIAISTVAFRKHK